MAVNKSKAEIATIDCSLVTIEIGEGEEKRELGFDTANQIAVEPQIETQESVKLIVKGILRAQKPQEDTITGNQITLTDNVFNPELVLILQGGRIKYDPENPSKIIGYAPPRVGTKEKGQPFKLNAYSAQYDAAGLIVQYEKITYPNCQGVPVAFGSEDGVFRAPQYTINSAPKTGESPYDINYVDSLPDLVDPTYKLPIDIVSIPNRTVEYEEGVSETYLASNLFAISDPTTGAKTYTITSGNEYAEMDEDGVTINLKGAGNITVEISVASDEIYAAGKATNNLEITMKV